MLIVGSKSLSYNFPEVDKKVKDIDIIGTKEDVKYLINSLSPKNIKETPYVISLLNITQTSTYDKPNIEILLSDNSESLSSYIEYDKAKYGLKYASPEVLFSLKKSHINFPIKFDKHIVDYTFLNKHFKGFDKLSEITKKNYKETEERLGKLKTPSLNKSVKEFFKQSNGFVKSYFIHDDMHKAVSHYGYPLYEKMQKDITIAKCHKEMWEEFTFENKCKCVLEEAYVISLERKIIPSIFGGKEWVSAEEGLNWSLMRICTTLCSGWFRKFATDNYFEIKNYINKNYVIDFLEKFNSGEIKKIA